MMCSIWPGGVSRGGERACCAMPLAVGRLLMSLSLPAATPRQAQARAPDRGVAAAAHGLHGQLWVHHRGDSLSASFSPRLDPQPWCAARRAAGGWGGRRGRRGRRERERERTRRFTNFSLGGSFFVALFLSFCPFAFLSFVYLPLQPPPLLPLPSHRTTLLHLHGDAERLLHQRH